MRLSNPSSFSGFKMKTDPGNVVGNGERESPRYIVIGTEQRTILDTEMQKVAVFEKPVFPEDVLMWCNYFNRGKPNWAVERDWERVWKDPVK